MKTLFFFVTILSISIVSLTAKGQSCTNCSGGTITGTFASGLGTTPTATGNSSLAGGFESNSGGANSLAFGFKAFTGINATNAVALGLEVQSTAPASFTLGRFLKSNSSAAFVIGSGAGSSGYLVNSVSGSLMVGFNSKYPTLFVSNSSTESTGRVSIGNKTSPTAKLHIYSDENEAAEIKLEHRTSGSNQFAQIYFGTHTIRAGNNENMEFTTPASRNFIFTNGKVGIGTTVPAQKLDIDGNIRLRSDAIIGTWSSNSLTFNTNSTARMVILADGKIGIGTTAPATMLHLTGELTTNSNILVKGKISGTSDIYDKLIITGSDNNDAAKIELWKGGADNYRSLKFLVTGNTGDFQFWTAGKSTNMQRMIINADGFVGIGTSLPKATLHVAGKTLVSENLTIGDIHKPGTLAVSGQSVFGSTVQIVSLASEYEKMIVADKDGVLSVAEMPIGDQMGSHIASQHLQMRGFFITNDADEGNAEGLFVGASGNVGIKTSDISNDDDFTVSSAANKPNVSFLVKGHSNKPATAWIKNGNKKIGFGVDGSKGYIYEDYNNGISKVITFQDGRVGIGDLTSGSSEITMTGSHKLFVTGGITAEEVKVKVKTAWSDYVFYPDYQLKSLAEVETFIKQNGHLPEVPNAKTVEENGIELGEMNALLLRKIEELTLYILEQEKRIKALEEK